MSDVEKSLKSIYMSVMFNYLGESSKSQLLKSAAPIVVRFFSTRTMNGALYFREKRQPGKNLFDSRM